MDCSVDQSEPNMDFSIDQSEPKAGCSKNLLGSEQHVNTNDKSESAEHNMSWEDQCEYEEIITSSPLQHYTIADNVIIEHIELAEGECAETECANEIERADKSDESQSNSSPVDHWENSEKSLFLQAIKKYGVHSNEKIAEMIPTKSLQEVEAAANYYRNQADLRFNFTAKHLTTRRKKPNKRHEGNNLAEWTTILNDNYSFEDLETITADAIRLIATCENFPPPSDCLSVDFQQAYHIIADALEGRPLRETNPETTEILRRAFVEACLSLKPAKSRGFEEFVKNLHCLGTQLLPKVEKYNCELKTLLSHYATVKRNNPLNIPIELLEIVSRKNLHED